MIWPLLRSYRAGVSGRGFLGWPAARSWHLPARDVAIAAAVGVVQIAGTALSSRHGSSGVHHGCWWAANCGSAEPLDALGYVLVAVGPVALLDRHRHPAHVLAVVFAATLMYAVIGYPTGAVYLALIVALATAVIAGHRPLGWLTVVAGWVLFLWLPPAVGRGTAPSPLGAFALAAWLLVLIGAADAVRIRRERIAEAERARTREAEQKAGEERLRIARELHDVLAHNISLINVQSGVALHLLEERPGQARAALSAINDASAEALREMRSVLGVLRRVDEQLPRAPTPSLAQLRELISRSAGTGLAVELEVEGEQRPIPSSVEMAGFRIVQESLTNVARHAEASSATVRVSYGAHELTVVIEDDGRGASGDAVANGGSGLVGMRERAVALGGDLKVGRRPGGGFSVRARLPIGDGR
jgi:signal transduction histidine kinase